MRLRPLVEAALETGCRRGELLGLQWYQVQLEPRAEIWLPASKTKTGKARRVPISTRLKSILEMRRDALRATLELKEHEQLTGTLYVFGNEIGQLIGSIKTAWRLACERAKITDLHFHDLRREAAVDGSRAAFRCTWSGTCSATPMWRRRRRICRARAAAHMKLCGGLRSGSSMVETTSWCSVAIAARAKEAARHSMPSLVTCIASATARL